MNDLISRQAAIDTLGEEPEVWTGKDEYAQGLNNQWHYDRNAILAVPSAQSEQQWIPCERELPELATYVLVSHVGTVFVDCLTMGNGDLLFWETGVFLAEEIRNLAWMPLPMPWKGGAKMRQDDPSHPFADSVMMGGEDDETD